MSELDLEQRVAGLYSAIDGKTADDRAVILDVIERYDPQLRMDLGSRLVSVVAQLPDHEHYMAAPESAGEEPLGVEPDVDSPAEQIVENGATIIWAINIHNEFLALPWESKSERKLDRQDTQFIRRNLRKQEEGQPSQSIFEYPHELGPALETWAALAYENGGRSARFLEVVTDQLHDYVKSNWAELSRETLAGHVQELAHSDLATDSLEQILSGYFEGPETDVDLAKAYVELGLSTEFILDDQIAIDELANITAFATNVLPSGSPLAETIVTSKFRFADKELSTLIQVGNDIAGAISIISTGSSRQAGDAWDSIATNVDVDRRFAFVEEIAEHDRLTLEEAKELYIKRARTQVIVHSAAYTDPEQIIEAARQELGEAGLGWLYDVYLGPNQDRAQFMKTFGFRSRREVYKNIIAGNIGVGITEIATIPVDRGYVLDIFFPEADEYTADERKQIAEYAGVALGELLPEIPPEAYEPFDGSIAMLEHQKLNQVDINGKVISYMLRRASELDQLQEHELNQLAWVGLPDIEGERYQSASEIISRLEQHERRFVSKRGFKVSFQSPDMTSQGYESMAIKQHPTRPGVLSVRLVRNGQSYSYLMNNRRQIDLEGRQIYGSRLQDILERRTLAILEDYATREAIDTEEGSISGAEKGVTTRIPTLVYLPAGHRFSHEAWEHYRQEQGKDLRVRNIQRKQESDAKGRNTTYRRATEVDDPNQEPLEIHVEDRSIV